MTAVQQQIQALAESVFSHEALNNRFYDRWLGGPLDLQNLEVFARNYLARTINTSTMVALSFMGTEDLKAKVEVVKNLFSEFGYGVLEKAHIVLLQNYLIDLLSRVSGRNYTLSDLLALPVLDSTLQFSAGQRDLYTNDGQKQNQKHVGTLLAQEWLAYSMLTRLYEGARNYKYLYPSDDDFHEHCEYFYIHIGEAEKEHKIQAIKAATQVCATPRDITEVTDSFNRFLDLTATYWNGIADAMLEHRPQRAISAV
jgi:hypothetical protein